AKARSFALQACRLRGHDGANGKGSSHLLQRGDAKQVQALLQRTRGELAKAESRRACFAFSFQHRAGFVEFHEGAGEVVQVQAELVWQAVGSEQLDRFRELQQFQRERLFFRGSYRNRVFNVGIESGAAEYAAYPGISIEQVRCGVAVEGQHAVPVE